MSNTILRIHRGSFSFQVGLFVLLLRKKGWKFKLKMQLLKLPYREKNLGIHFLCSWFVLVSNIEILREKLTNFWCFPRCLGLILKNFCIFCLLFRYLLISWAWQHFSYGSREAAMIMINTCTHRCPIWMSIFNAIIKLSGYIISIFL